MYSCPTDDIHSVYLDNELPLSYVKEYETHLEYCAECKAKLEKLKVIHNALQIDSKSITLDSTYLSQSFDRLQTKMSYAKHTGKNKSPLSSVNLNQIQFKMPDWKNVSKIAIAAAAAVVVIALPVKFTNNKKQNTSQVASITPVSRPQTVPISQQQNFVVNGNIGNGLSHTVSTQNFRSSSFSDMDVFRPVFDDNQNISIKISIPGLDDQGQEQVMEIKLPVNTITGQLP